MNEHKKVSCFNHGNVSIHRFFFKYESTDVSLLLSGLFVGQKLQIWRFDWSERLSRVQTPSEGSILRKSPHNLLSIIITVKSCKNKVNITNGYDTFLSEYVYKYICMYAYNIMLLIFCLLSFSDCMLHKTHACLILW